MWIAVGVGAWLAVAAIVGVLIGRMIRQRDRQVPDPVAAEQAARTRRDAAGPDSADLPPPVGRGRARPS